MGDSRYNSYLNSGAWRILRLHRMKLASGMCELCGHHSQQNHGHHVTYRNLEDATVNDIRILCEECHKQVHFVLRDEPWIKRLKTSQEKWACCLKYLGVHRVSRKKEKRKKNKGKKQKFRAIVTYQAKPKPARITAFCALAKPSTPLVMKRVNGVWTPTINPLFKRDQETAEQQIAKEEAVILAACPWD